MKVTGSLRQRLARLFAVVGVVTALLTLLTVGALVQMQRATVDRVDVFGPALLSSETLYGAYSDQETGLRGFLLSAGDDAFLDPYDQGRDARAGEPRAAARPPPRRAGPARAGGRGPGRGRRVAA